MKNWNVPVSWQMCTTIRIQAETLEEAIKIARDDEGVLSLPQNGEYVDGSWEVSCDDADTIRECYNDNQGDESSQNKVKEKNNGTH